MTPSVTPPASPPAPTGFRGLPRFAQLGLAFLLGLLTLLLIQHAWRRLGQSGRPADAWPGQSPAAVYLVDLNRAPREEIQQLPGVGPVLARRIVDYRERHGRFESVNDLEQIDGIGPMLVDGLRSRIKLGNTAKSAGEMKPSYPRKGELQGRIDLNRANRDELLMLPGIGPVLADRILADRQANGPYRTVQDLTRIKGIKGKTLEKLLPHVYVKEDAAVARGRDGA